MYSQVNDPTAEDRGYRFLGNLDCFSKFDKLLRQSSDKENDFKFFSKQYLRHLSGRKIQRVWRDPVFR